MEGYHGYLLFVWMYGLFVGGAEVTLRVYCYEKLRVKQYSRGWGYIQGAKAVPYLIGFPITAYICDATGDPKAGFYFSFICCILGATVLFLMECFKGSSLYGSRMDLCKTDTNLTMYEMNGSVGHEPASGGSDKIGLVQEPRAASINGHLKCTCLPSVGLELEEKIKELEEASIAMAEVSMASNNSKVHFNEEIQVVPEDEEDEELASLAQALYSAKAELLECISEEDLYREAIKSLLCSDEDFSGGLRNGEDRMFNSVAMMSSTSPDEVMMARRSQSEPDLVHLLSSPTTTIDPNQLAEGRQKAWHQFKSIKSEAAANTAAASTTASYV